MNGVIIDEYPAVDNSSSISHDGPVCCTASIKKEENVTKASKAFQLLPALIGYSPSVLLLSRMVGGLPMGSRNSTWGVGD